MILHTSKQKQWQEAEAYVWEKTKAFERELVESIREQARVEVLKKLHRINQEICSGLPEDLKKRDKRGEWEE